MTLVHYVLATLVIAGVIAALSWEEIIRRWFPERGYRVDEHRVAKLASQVVEIFHVEPILATVDFTQPWRNLKFRYDSGGVVVDIPSVPQLSGPDTWPNWVWYIYKNRPTLIMERYGVTDLTRLEGSAREDAHYGNEWGAGRITERVAREVLVWAYNLKVRQR